MSKFYLETKKDLEQYFKSKGIRPQYAPKMLVTTVLLTLSMFLTHYLAVTSVNSGYRLLSLLPILLNGVVAALICFMPVHEASHASTTEKPWVWRSMGALHDWINGCSFYNWCHQHFLGHHPFTNVQSELGEYSLDPDTVTGDNDIRRIKRTQTWLTRYYYQYIYAPVIYGLLGIKFRTSDFVILFVTKKNGLIRVNPMDNWHLFNFFAGKAFWFWYRLYVPAQLIGWGPAFAVFFAEDLITSWILALVFQVNHVIETAIWPEIDPKANFVNMDWAEMQLKTTLDYGHSSPLTHFLTGALNYQVTHHLFPYISQVHYPDIAPIIKRNCKKYNLPYYHLPTFLDALGAHLGYLKLLGAEKSERKTK